MYYVMRDANTEGLRWPVRLSVTSKFQDQTKGNWVDPQEGAYCNYTNALQDKPSSESALRFWSVRYLSHKFSRWMYKHELQDYREYQCEYSDIVKDDCLRIRVTSFTVS